MEKYIRNTDYVCPFVEVVELVLEGSILVNSPGGTAGGDAGGLLLAAEEPGELCRRRDFEEQAHPACGAWRGGTARGNTGCLREAAFLRNRSDSKHGSADLPDFRSPSGIL